MSSDPLKLRVLEASRALRAPTRESESRQRLRSAGLAVAAALAMAMVLLIVGGPAHAAGRPLGTGLALLGAALVVALGASRFAVPTARSMLPRPGWQLLAVVVAVPALVWLALSLGHLTYADPFERTGWRCLGLTLATAPWPFAALLLRGRRPDPVHPMLSGAALAAAAAAWAAVMVELWCPLAKPGHVVFGHVAPLLVLVAAGAFTGRRLLGLSWR